MRVYVCSFNKSMVSTKRPSDDQWTEIEGSLREPFTRETPVLSFQSWSYAWNYMKISNSTIGERYYWVNDVSIDGLLKVVSFTEDYLATFRSSILSGSQFILRQQNISTPDLIDTAYMSQGGVSLQTVEWGGSIWSTSVTDGSYILGVESTGTSTLGTVYMAMDYKALSKIRERLFSAEGFERISDSVVRLSQYIISARWIPVPLSKIPNSGQIDPVFGSTTIPVTEGNCLWVDEHAGYVQISGEVGYIAPNHPQFTDAQRWLNYSPFRSCTWSIPPFGTVELPGSYLRSTGIYPKVLVDVVSGSAKLRMVDTVGRIYFETVSEIGVDIGLSSRTVNVAGMLTGVSSVVSGAVGAIGGVATKNALPVINGLAQLATGAANTAIANVPQVSQISQQSGNLGQYFEPVSITTKFIRVLPYNEKLGYAVNDLKAMTTLRGYTYCQAAELRDSTATASERAAVETAMNTGVYIE